MPDKFAIKVTCTRCWKSDLLVSEKDKAIPMTFDTHEEALAHRKMLSKRQAGTFGNPDPNPAYECPNKGCGVISPLHELQIDVVRYQSEAGF